MGVLAFPGGHPGPLQFVTDGVIRRSVLPGRLVLPVRPVLSGRLVIPGLTGNLLHPHLRRGGRGGERGEGIAHGSPCRSIFKLQVHVHRAVLSRVDGMTGDVLGSGGRQIDRAVDTAEIPPVRVALGVVDGGVVRFLQDLHLQGVGAAEAQQGGDVIGEAVEAALVGRTSGLAVDAYMRVGHHAFKDDADLAAAPGGRDLESVAVFPEFVQGLAAGTGRAAVIVFAESLQFPLGRDLDGRPAAAVHPVRAAELPGAGIIGSCAGEVERTGLLCGSAYPCEQH